MTRVVVILLLVSSAVAAPVPKGVKAKADYYPLAVGTKWEYVRHQNADNVWAEEVTESVTKDGATIATVRITPGGANAVPYDTSYKADADGWYFLTQGGVSYDPPAMFVKADPKPGDTWELKYAMGGNVYAATATVGQPEKVTVPAGEYTALPVTIEFTQPGQRRAYTNWYIAGVGMVKQVSGGRVTQELKSYTPAK